MNFGDESKFNSNCIHIYLIIMFAIFPLAFWENYNGLPQVKYLFFMSFSIILLAILLIKKILDDEVNFIINIKCFSSVDIFILLFLVSNAISTYFAMDRKEAFLGMKERFMGLATIIAFVMIYFIVSRCEINLNKVIWAFIISSNIVNVIAVLHYFNIDMIGAYKNVSVSSREVFISTFGNNDYYGSFLSISIAFMISLFCFTEDNKIRKVVGFTLIIEMMAMIASCNDGVYFSIAVIVVILAVVTLGKKNTCIAFIRSSCYMICGMVFMYGLNHFFQTYRKLDTCSSILNHIPLLIGLFIGLIILQYKLEKLDWNLVVQKKKIIIAAFFAIIFFSVVIIVYRYVDILNGIFKLNESFGNYRGYIWINLVKIYKKGNILQKIFGFGPEMVGLLCLKYCVADIQRTGMSFDAAHNEFFQYFMTIGIVGLILYSMFCVMVIKRTLQSARENNQLFILFVPIVAYLINSTLNIAQLMSTPLFFLLIAIAESFTRKLSVNRRLT